MAKEVWITEIIAHEIEGESVRVTMRSGRKPVIIRCSRHTFTMAVADALYAIEATTKAIIVPLREH